MFPQIKQIQRFVVEEHIEQLDMVGLEVSENGIGLVPRVDVDGVGCEDRSVWEYRHTGHLDSNGSYHEMRMGT